MITITMYPAKGEEDGSSNTSNQLSIARDKNVVIKQARTPTITEIIKAH